MGKVGKTERTANRLELRREDSKSTCYIPILSILPASGLMYVSDSSGRHKAGGRYPCTALIARRNGKDSDSSRGGTPVSEGSLLSYWMAYVDTFRGCRLVHPRTELELGEYDCFLWSGRKQKENPERTRFWRMERWRVPNGTDPHSTR